MGGIGRIREGGADEKGRRLSRPLRIVVSKTRPVVHPITTMGLDNVLSLFDTLDEAVRGESRKIWEGRP